MSSIPETFGFWYLATPYTKYPHGFDAAAKEAARIAGGLLKQDIVVYSPIVHSHHVATAADIPLTGHEFWMKADAPMVAAAQGLIVAKMEGWRDSAGVEHEIQEFLKSRRPIIYLDPATI